MLLFLGLYAWVWVAAVSFILLLIAEAWEWNFFYNGVVLALAVLGLWLTGVPIFSWIDANRLWFGLGLLAYFPLGVGWSFLKWYFFVLKKLEKDQAAREERKKYSSMYEAELTAPKAAEHKERILTWIAFWPTSVVWSLLDDFVREIAEKLFRAFSGTFQKISERVYSKVLREVEEKENRGDPRVD